MPQRFDPRKIERELRAQQRKAEAAWKREAARVDRENQRRVNEYNRKVDQEKKRRAAEYNRRVEQENRRIARENKKAVNAYNKDVERVNQHNAQVIAELNRRLRLAQSTGPRYTTSEQGLADRVQSAVAVLDDREYDTFLAHAEIDGAAVAAELHEHLDALGVDDWFAPVSIQPGKSQSLQIDNGLLRASAGIALLTPAFIAGRFWTKRELGALLHKPTLIPVLHNVTFDDVKEYSGILPDLAGFETARDSIEVIAQKIAAAVLGEADAQAA
jgi:hypothetical protein